MKIFVLTVAMTVAVALHAQQPAAPFSPVPVLTLCSGPAGMIACAELHDRQLREGAAMNAEQFAATEFHDTTMIAPHDSTPQPPKRRLQPENLSIMESAMWGEGGIMRGIGFTGPLTPVSRKNELTARRTMLSTHQIAGFVTMACMLGAVYCGQKTIDGDFTYQKYHQGFVTATITSYSITGLLAILSPPPSIRRDEVSTTTIHKTLAWAHVAGMILTPIIGGQINRRQGYGAAARFHQISAYVTTTIFAASLLTMTL